MKLNVPKVLLAGIALIAGLNGFAVAENQNWLSGFSYRKGIILNNSGSGALSEYLVKIENPVYNETGLVGSWHFDALAGNQTPDTSGNAKNGAVYGAALAAGKFGKALSFSGTDNYVDCGNLGAVKTVEFYLDDTSYSDGILELNPASYISIAAGKIIAAGFSSPVIYVNGTADKLLSKGFNHIVITTDTAVEASAVKIGTANSDYTNGVIDEVRLYNRVLSSDETAQYFKAKAKLNYGDIRFTDSDGTGLIPYWMEKDGVFWVKVPLIPKDLNKIIYVYYGNGSADSVSDTALADEVSKRKPAKPEPAANIYAEQENLER